MVTSEGGSVRFGFHEELPKSSRKFPKGSRKASVGVAVEPAAGLWGRCTGSAEYRRVPVGPVGGRVIW